MLPPICWLDNNLKIFGTLANDEPMSSLREITFSSFRVLCAYRVLLVVILDNNLSEQCRLMDNYLTYKVNRVGLLV